MPRGATPDLKEAIREEMTNQAQPVKDKAAEAFTAAVQKSRELDIFNDCYAKSLKLLRDSYRPQQFPPVLEQWVELKDQRAQVLGGNLLASIQPTPSRSATPKGKLEPKEKRAVDSRQDDATDLGAPVPEKSDQRDLPPSTKSSSKKSKTDEPEDVL
jgi:hypothetical protein